MLHIPFDNTYARQLPGLYTATKPATAPAPALLYLNHALAAELGLDASALDSPAGTALLAGNVLPAGAEPLAQAYAGHQFGGFSPQLGDGRALLLGEVVDTLGRRRDIAFKGSGRTPYSRGGDGKAAVGPMLREVLIGEAMHALGIPSTRALAVVATGELVRREAAFPGAILTRVAASHLRVGTFQFFAARGETDKLRQLAEYTIHRHDPALVDKLGRMLALLRAVAGRQASLIAQWMQVGFIHGVMNTDNMTLSGETIDYGPCAFMDRYDPATVFSSIDHHGRYAYANQPTIARWNLARLAESLLPLLHEDPQQAVDAATRVIDDFPLRYEAHWLAVMQAKLGLRADSPAGLAGEPQAAADAALAREFLANLQGQGVDFTLAFRQLADVAETSDATGLRQLFADSAALDAWLPRWQLRLAQSDSPQASAAAMRGVNPWIIPRNQRVEEALTVASQDGDLEPFKRLLALLQQPYVQPADVATLQAYTQPAPAAQSACFQTFCGT